jgi:hypothetical protein
MLISTVDGETQQPVTFEADDNRVAQLNHFVMSNPDILGMGRWSAFGKKASDAVEAQAFAVSQLAFVEQKTYEKQYAPLTYQTLLGNTISYADGEWAQSIEYQIVDYVGQGKRISGMAQDLPEVDVAYARKMFAVAQGGIQYSYTTEDLRVSAYLQRPLPITKLKAANMAYLRHLNTVALTGEASSGFTGLFNNASVVSSFTSSVAVPWSTTATSDQIIADVVAAVASIMTATQNNSAPNFLAVSIPTFENFLKPRSTVSDTTTLAFLQGIYPNMKIFPVFELAGAGTGGTLNRAVFFNADDENMVYHIPMPLRFLAPQYLGLKIIVPGEYKYAGLEIRRVPTVAYRDNT